MKWWMNSDSRGKLKLMCLKNWNKYCLIVIRLSKKGMYNKLASHVKSAVFVSGIWEISIRTFARLYNSIIEQWMKYVCKFIYHEEWPWMWSQWGLMERSDSKASSFNGKTERSASPLCFSSTQMCTVIDNLQGSWLTRWGRFMLLVNENTVEMIVGKHCLHLALISKRVVPWCRSVNLPC